MKNQCRAPQSPSAPASARGFSLLEIMVALALGLLLSAGILTLFDGTSRTNKVQDGLAHLQENGRFAITRIQDDLRMGNGQYCSNTSGKATMGAAVPLLALRAPQVYAPMLGLPDSPPNVSGTGLAKMNSVDGTGYPSASAATVAYALSPRYFVQGYSCPSSGTCGSGLLNDTPAQGIANLDRLPASDVLTIRYQRGSGWPLLPGNCAASDPLADGNTLTISPQAGDDPVNVAGDPNAGMKPGLALISDCVNSNVLPISTVTGNTLTIGIAPGSSSGILTGAPSSICTGSPMRDVRVFNFSHDFVTVSYYIGLRTDQNPDARPNSAVATRLLPVLIRRENGVEQELVQGVDQMRLRFGVQDSGGNTRFMTAAQVTAGGNCPGAPEGVINEPGCLWRAVRTVEVRLLMNSVNEVFTLDSADLQYSFDGAITTALTPTTALPSGLTAGSMPRREFVGYVSNRNYNF